MNKDTKESNICFSESNDNGVFDTYRIENCINAKYFHLPLRIVNNLEIINDVDADCELITSLSSNKELIINEKVEMTNCPNANLPWRVFYNKDFNGKSFFQNVKLAPGTIIQGFDQAILEDIKLDGSIGFVDSGATSDKGKIALVNTNISFKLISSGKVVLSTSGNGDLKTAIHNIYGREIAENIVDVDYIYDNIKIN